ncbi:hypothetical protein QWJ26_26475 [Streptomyces sp. CSDS2]|uniref:hypothetical protein n=1 Tax=Streptomyces sp. CSDS2 TaxID=3055051 RepID=UPI0025B2636A|nr:hypothetical protein [Streptomyces sp. CSDS2]MDN3263291.1 hypothetical protein [Streptomyces sp. CSDS2]
MRLREDATEQELLLIEGRMYECAQAHGLHLVATYYEEGPGVTPSRLIRKLIRDDVRHVVVPSLMQITEHPLLGLMVAEAITLDAGALLYEASEVQGWCSSDA